jgi:hypothetical protein
MKAKLTAEALRKAIEERKPASMTQLAHRLGHRGSVGGTLARRLRALLPGIDGLLAANKHAKGGGGDGKSKVAKKTPKARKTATAKPAKPSGGKWPHDERSGYRTGSSYGACFSILAGHKAGLPKTKLVQLLAQATGKDLKREGFDAQIVCSARFGYWVERKGDNVRLSPNVGNAPNNVPGVRLGLVGNWY